MFTHKVISKDIDSHGLVLGIEFTDGVKKFTESVRPQDENGLKYFLKQRLASLNSLNQLDAIKVGDVIDLSETPTYVDPETAKLQEYEAKKIELIRVKQEVELGLATQEELDAKVQEAVAAKEAIVADTVEVIDTTPINIK